MEYLILIILAVGVIWTVYYATNKSEKQKKAAAGKADESSLIINIPGQETGARKKASQQSLDSIYAAAHGMWTCRFCETINDGWAPSCSACGAKK